MTVELIWRELHGAEIEPWLDQLGALRIAVFRDYPYLYEGSLEYERSYLRRYAKSPRSLVLLLTAEDQVLGATTCIPLVDEEPAFQEPFASAGLNMETVFYFGESILLPDFRGRGFGKEFFKRREAHAQSCGAVWTAFCAVDRAADHPARPPEYRPLNSFWQSQGYQKQPGMQAILHWRDVGEATESPKTLTFWLKSWNR